MEVQFVDRILICSDCHSEFVFTAGEQLFFHDKQFKNDPKRCKPCKSRRSGLTAGANGTGPAAAGLSRTETRTECSECGVPTTVPFKPTQGRPVLCRQCFQTKSKIAAAAVSIPVPLAALSVDHTAAQLSAASAEASGTMMSADSAVGAAASMAAASPQSSVASAADLASITAIEPTPTIMSGTEIPTELLAAANAATSPVEQIAARVEASDA